MTSQIRILIVDDQWLVREGIASLLELEEDLKIVGTAADGDEAITQAAATTPDVILMDIRMPNKNGIEAAGQIRQQQPACQIIMLTTFDDEEYIVQSLLAGACGYLMKDTPATNLARAIRMAHAGIYQLDPEVAGKLIGSLQSPLPPPSSAQYDPSLTPRELDILRLLAKGATNREIANELVISEGTVKNHISNILQRLDIRDRTQAAVYAVRNGIA
ncbi:MAG: response regulator transcription factor [Candidatus Promineifilaceae bacterium]|nr:response regulator transcription factor [Candidatus Promineifilaceae bacterium]